ncbi:MAG TPA: NAD(P)-dependent oxidoreductase [Steroidobacteraceae bacterium]|nr:NAD(P)-dependent oxidoreductase [Steroidobacteraceae bacterium]
MKVLVTGSSGRIGSAVAARLKLRHQVTGLDLKPGPLTDEVADVSDTARIAGLLPGVDAIVHTAALHVPDLAARTVPDFHEVNVDATQRLLQAAGSAGVVRFVYTSTTSLYGDAMLPSGGAAAWVDEALVPQPRDVYDETKLAAEEACRQAARDGLPCTSLRMSRCFPEEARLVAIYRLYRGVDAEDVAQAHELALASQDAGFEIYNVSAPTPFRREDCPRLFEDAASVLLERHPWAEEEFRRRAWQLPRSIDRVYVVDKAVAQLGYRPLHDFAALFRRPAG